MARSDLEDSGDTELSYDSFKMVRNANETLIDKSHGNTIHSGHFMVSCLNDEENEDDIPIGNVKTEEMKGFNFGNASKKTQKSYSFVDPKATAAGIDNDLSKLFQCLTLAYSGKLTSPKWKNFKGLKLTIKDKVRLNNIIWREWHAQFVLYQKPKICQFEPPISDRTHTKPEAIVLEGKYWKRKLSSVTTEYMKWRMYHKKCKSDPEDRKLMRQFQVAGHAELLERMSQTPTMCRSPAERDVLLEEDFMDLSDTLFSTLTQGSFAFPTPRELSQLGNADIIQPGLIGLQPSLEEYMDTLEPLPSLQEMMGSTKSQQRASGVGASMLVDPIADPFFNDTSVGSLNADLLTPSSSPSVLLEPQPVLQPQQQQQLPTAASSSSSSETADSLVADILQNIALLQSQPPTPFQATASPQRSQNAAAQLISLVLQNGLATGSSLDLTSVLAAVRQGGGAGSSATSSGVGNVTAAPAQVRQEALPLSALLRKGDLQAGATPCDDVVLLGDKTKPAGQQQQKVATPLQNLLQGINQPTTSIIKLKSEPAQSLTQTAVSAPPSFQPSAHVSPPSAHVPPPSAHVRHHSGGQLGEGGRPGRGRGRPKSDSSRRASTGSLAHQQAIAAKPQQFKVPETPTRFKQVKIAPAPSQPPKGLGHVTGHVTGKAVPLGVVAVAPATDVRKSVTSQNSFLAQLLQGQDTAVPSVALKQEPSSNYAYIQPKLLVTKAQSQATQPSNAVFSLATPKSNTILMSDQSNTVKIADLLSSSSISLTTAQLPNRSVNSGQFRVPSPTGSVDSEPRSRHASSESVGSPVMTPIKEEKAASPGRPSYSRRKNELDAAAYKEHRRASHISAEQKRRFNIKYGFDTLCQLVPTLAPGPSAKVSKAAILQKAAEYARKLKLERSRMQEEAELLRREIESLTQSISTCQSQLPATGVPVSGQRVDRMRAVFEEAVRSRTLNNWKYWIFSMIVIGMHADGSGVLTSRVSLFDTYNNTVSTSCMEEFCRTVLSWLDQHCSLVALRPAVLPSLTKLSTSTSILTDPSRVPEEATKAVIQLPEHGTEIN